MKTNNSKFSFFLVSLAIPAAEGEEVPVDGRLKREVALRKVRKPEHSDDYLHSYKFKNSIERRFSRSQDTEVRRGEIRIFISRHWLLSGGNQRYEKPHY